MNFHLGVIREVRDHPSRPLLIWADVGGEDLELGWLTCDLGSWASVGRADLGAGQEVMIWDTGYVAHPDRWRVVAIFPSDLAPLPDNTRRPARRGDAVAISGSPQLTAAAKPTILVGIPPVMSLGHDLSGVILDD